MSFYDQFQKYDYPMFGYIRLPEVKISVEEKAARGLPKDATNLEFLRALALEGFRKKIKPADHAVYGARVKRELETIQKLGFTDYYLLIWQVCVVSDKLQIARDYGRGSAAGSLVFSLIDVTNVDPIKYNLFFERFISEARAKMKIVEGVTYIDGGLAPDVDLDFDKNKKDLVVKELESFYPGRICRISTFNTLTSKLLIKECMKVVGGASEEDAKKVSDLIPKVFGIVWDIEETRYGQIDEDTGEVNQPGVKEFDAWAAANPVVYEVAMGLRDLIRNKGTHPSGYVVSYDPLEKCIPVEFTNEQDEDDEDNVNTSISSAFSMEDIANLAIKVDLLSARACTVIAEVLKLTGNKIEDIDIEDPFIYQNLQNLTTPIGLFQIEASTNLKVVKEAQPKTLGGLADVIAIARPGALSFLGKYVENKHESVHPLFDPILQQTRGVCLYQEQMMQLAHAIGFTLLEAETLRRIVGKKKVDEVEPWKQKIREKVAENNLAPETGDLLWKILKDSSKYSFNASHALSFASLTALTVYLKFKYPQQYFLALLRHPKVKSKKIEEIAQIEQELKFFGIKLLPPDLVKSDIDFKIEGPNIRFGLSSIKGISEKTIEHLLKFKTEHSNRFQLFESAKSAGLNVSVLCALIQCGCLSSNSEGTSRPSLALQAQLWNILTSGEKKKALALGEQFGYNLFRVVEHLRSTLDPKSKAGHFYIKASRYENLLKKYAPKKAIYEMNKKHLGLTNLFYERMLIGYSYSEKLGKLFEQYFSGLMTVEEVNRAEDKDKVSFVAIVSEKPVERTSANKNKYARFQLSDETGSIQGMIFNTKNQAKLDEIKLKHGGKIPQKDCIVFCHGQKKGDTVFLDNIADQGQRIYTKFGQIEKDARQDEQSE